MKVNISYTVNLDEIPLEVDRLVGVTKKQFAVLANKIESLTIADIEKFLQETKHCRQHMLEVDNKLNDCVAILEGYLQAKEQVNAPPPYVPAEPVPDLSDLDSTKAEE